MKKFLIPSPGKTSPRGGESFRIKGKNKKDDDGKV
jgi:hypothetical protein